eukprot:200569-Pelagomonas_calceolata.AAC.1
MHELTHLRVPPAGDECVMSLVMNIVNMNVSENGKRKHCVMEKGPGKLSNLSCIVKQNNCVYDAG